MAELNNTEKAEIKACAIELAQAARRETLAYFRSINIATANKDPAGFDPVTAADRASERVMREILQDKRPQDGILGEEFGDKEGSSGLTWVLDPIDGTRGFISGTPTWGVLVSLRNAWGPIFGLIDQPYIGERFIGGFGEAYLDGPMGVVPLKTRAACGLDHAILLSTFPEIGTALEKSAFDRLKAQVRLTRYGMDCYGYALLAAGHVDLVVEAGLKAYDIQAPIAVIEAAGGMVTDWRGRPVHDGGRVLAAANAQLHSAALEILSAVSE